MALLDYTVQYRCSKITINTHAKTDLLKKYSTNFSIFGKYAVK